MTLNRLCGNIRSRFCECLDGRLSGKEMQRIHQHLDECKDCAEEFREQESLLRALSSLGTAQATRKAPRDLPLRIRVALDQERRASISTLIPAWKILWSNSIGPFLLQLSMGLASAVLLLGSVALTVGLFARPEKAAALDEPLGAATSPRLLYELPAVEGDGSIGNATAPIVVEAYVNPDGLVYDYRIVSGPNDSRTRSAIEDKLLFSIFEPARVYGKPVRGLAVLSFADVSVHG